MHYLCGAPTPKDFYIPEQYTRVREGWREVFFHNNKTSMIVKRELGKGDQQDVFNPEHIVRTILVKSIDTEGIKINSLKITCVCTWKFS